MINAYTVTPLNSFEQMFLQMRSDLYDADPITRGEWQSQHISMPMLEMLHVTFDMDMPATAEEAGKITGARLPWAEDHFLERVGGEPLNPSPSEQWWPFRKKSEDGDTNKEHKSEGAAFSHTYPERMWPKEASPGYFDEDGVHQWEPMHGIRFDYGDLGDVVNQLCRAPLTRQAYLPIWFPEDTGAVHGKRVPCTLGYHFIIHDGKLDISYFMRSTDLLRHFQDDVYLAIRLAQFVVEEVNIRLGVFPTDIGVALEIGKLVFHTANMHIFEGDRALIDYWKTQGKSWF